MSKQKKKRQLTESAQLMADGQVTAFALRYNEKEGGWETLTYKILNDSIVNIHKTPADLRQINFEKFKRAVLKWRSENE